MFFAALLGGLCAVSFTPLALAMNDEDNLDLNSININNVNKTLYGYKGMTLLHLAAADADEKAVAQCLKLGANALMPDRKGNSPLNLALQSKKCTLELVKLLVDAMRIEAQQLQTLSLHQIDQKIIKCYQTAFGEKRNLSFEEIFLNGLNALSMTPLDLAITFQTENPKFEQIIEYLLINGAHLDIGNSKSYGLFTVTSPLFQASRRGLHNIVRLLFEYSGKKITKNFINKHFGDSHTLLHAAITSGSIETVKVLLKFGADPEIKTKDTNQTPIKLVEDCAKNYPKKNATFMEIQKILQQQIDRIREDFIEEEADVDASLDEESDTSSDDGADVTLPQAPGLTIPAQTNVLPPVAPINPVTQPRLLDLMGWQGRTTMRLIGALNEIFCEPLALDEAILCSLPAVLSYHRINKFKAIDYIAGILPLCAYGLKAYRGAREPNLCNKPYTFYDTLTQGGVFLATNILFLSQVIKRKQQGIYAPSSLFQKLTVTPFLINLGRVLTSPIRPTISALT